MSCQLAGAVYIILMGYDFIKFRDKNVHLHDHKNLIVMALAVHVAGSAARSKGVKALLEHWTRDWHAPGVTGTNFDEFIHSDSDRETVVGILVAARDLVTGMGETVPGNLLQEWSGLSPDMIEWADVPSSGVLKTLDQYIELLNV